MSHANARLTLHDRVLLVQRVRVDRRPVAHVAKELGVSRQCAHRWVKRFDAEGWGALHDRSSRPHRSPRRTPAAVEARILAERQSSRRGPDWIADELGVAARTVTRVLRRHGVARLAECDPHIGTVIRASRHTTIRYERRRPGELVHVDVKKIGKIPDGGGWRPRPRFDPYRIFAARMADRPMSVTHARRDTPAPHDQVTPSTWRMGDCANWAAASPVALSDSAPAGPGNLWARPGAARFGGS